MTSGWSDLGWCCSSVGGTLLFKLFIACLIVLPEFRATVASIFVILLKICGMGFVPWVAWKTRFMIWRMMCNSPSRKQMFVVSCIAVSFDPLFLYIPFVDENNKCLGIDKTLRTAALVLRSLTDIPSVLHIIDQIRRISGVPKVEPLFWMDSLEVQELHDQRRLKIRRIHIHIAIYILAILPIPQVMLVMFTRTPTIAYLVLQYLVRAYQIYQSCMKFKRVRRWLKGAFNFLLYILAAHVLGAFWYFSSIERETSCWQQACKNIAGCRHAYYCSNTSASTNIAFLNESCPVNPSNATLFDFGIYLDALQSGNTGPVGFLTKYFYTFWWGIKNLSNFGTNLEPSSYTWESCFAIIISIIGLLLFMYLIGNVQTYIQMQTQKSLSNEDETIKTKYQDIDMWMSDSELPEHMKMEITKHLKERKVVEKHPDVDMDINFLLSHIPTGLKHSFKEHICINALKKVPKLHNMSEVALSMMCAYAKTKVYHKNRYIFRKGKLLDTMIIIIKGTIRCSNAEESRTSSSMITEQRIRRKGDCYGEELLDWERTKSRTLTSKQDVLCQTKVEALVFTLESKMEDFLGYWRVRQWDQNFTPRVEMTTSDNGIEMILNEMDEQSRTKEKINEDEDEDLELIQKNIMFNGTTDEHRALEQNIQVQGDMLREQLALLVLVRQSMLQFHHDMATQARRLDGIAEILAKSGYPGIPPRPT